MNEASRAIADAAGVISRPSVLQLRFREVSALYAAYMPILANGGIFVPTLRKYELTTFICCCHCPMTLNVIRSRQVAWITPRWEGRTQGAGVHFSNDEKTLAAEVEDRKSAGHAAAVGQADADDLTRPNVMANLRKPSS